MDVRFYPPPTQSQLAAEPPRLGPSHYLDSPYCNKFESDMYMGMSDPGQDFLPGNQFRVPASPSQQSQQSSKQAAGPWKREASSQADAHRLHWSYPVPSLGDEDFNIPPITPPTLPEHMLAYLPESESGSYHPLCPPSASHNGLHPFTLQGMDLSGMLSQDGGLLPSSLSVMQQMVDSESKYNGHPHLEVLRSKCQSSMGHHQGSLAAVKKSHLNTQLGLCGNPVSNGSSSSPSPPGSKSATPSPSSSVHEEEADDSLKMNGAEKRAAPEQAKKPKTPKKKKKRDPNEPQKPVSAYALFFRDRQAAIKAQNPNATFGEVSKIVASMWDGLGEEQKQMYKKNTETAKKEYLKQLAAYRANLVSQSYCETVDVKGSQASQIMATKPPGFPSSGHSHHYMSHPYHQQQHQQQHQQHQQHQQQPGFSPHLPASMQGMLSRGVVPRPSAAMSGGVMMSAASPPPVQISPPLHQHLNIHHQQQMSSHHPLLQGFPGQSEFQNTINVTSSPLDYHCRNTPDWTPDYGSTGALQRDKALYLI
ncbi:thymocyte selection-associated high mobility group box protein TOX isoform X2 [Clupea harengus]|uniref:Thymocyte selection-associated high mobility group box protein TOX isoform X2 n=1 Tax=Clupea harengus TaxID=7950 RepID=A0A6P8EHI2_CLUHA|nr:thymocyte selection-associated high mobility group box protein TOX isoform X2 [Clupea harengus]